MEQLGRERIARHRGRDPQVRQRLDPVAARGDVPAPDGRRQRLGHAADPDHPVQPVERGVARRGLVLEVGEDVVLDDDQIVRLGELEDPVRGRRRQRRAGRVVDGGVGHVEARTMLGQRPRERREVGSGRGHRHGDDPRPVRAQQRQEVEEAGIVDQHRVARLDQEAADQIERVGPAIGEQDLVGTGLDALLGHPPREQRAKRLRAHRRGISDQRRRAARPRRSAQPFADRVFRHPALGHPTAARRERAGPGGQRLAKHPQRIDLALDLRADPVERKRCQRGRDVEPRAAARSDNTFGGETVVRLHDRGLRVPAGGRHRPNGRQPRAARQGPPLDPVADRGHHLFGPGRSPLRVRRHRTVVPGSTVRWYRIQPFLCRPAPIGDTGTRKSARAQPRQGRADRQE